MVDSGVHGHRGRHAPATESELRKKVWARVVQKRVREMGTVDNKVRERLVEQHCSIEEIKETTLASLEAVMQSSYQLILNDTEKLEKRREAHDRLSHLLRGMEATIRPFSANPTTPAPSAASRSTENSVVPSSVVIRPHATLGTTTTPSTVTTTATVTDPSAAKPNETAAVTQPSLVTKEMAKTTAVDVIGEPSPPVRKTNKRQSDASNESLTTTTTASADDDDDTIGFSPRKRRKSLQHADTPGSLSRDSINNASNGITNRDVNWYNNSNNSVVGIPTGATLSQKMSSHSPANGRFVSTDGHQREHASFAVTANRRPPFVPQPSHVAQQFLRCYRRSTPVSTRQVLHVSPDKQINSRSNYTCCTELRTDFLRVQFDQKRLEDALVCSFDTRLQQWDPYWNVVDYLGIGRTSQIKWCEPNGTSVRTAARFSFDPTTRKVQISRRVLCLSKVRDLPWNKKQAGHSDHAILLHLLPLKAGAKKEGADTHLWPKGTFIEVCSSEAETGRVVTKPVALEQRKQDSHDATKWSGFCEPLHLNEHVRDPSQPFSFSLVCHDSDEYMYAVTLCRRRKLVRMYDELTAKRVSSYKLHRLRPLCTTPKAEGLKLATQVPQSDEDIMSKDELVKNVSLLCPMSHTPLKTPVRSPKCRHVGCFDLLGFLCSQESVKFQRWKCPLVKILCRYRN